MTQERDQKRHQKRDFETRTRKVSTVWLPMESECLSIADFSWRQFDFVHAHKNLHVVAQTVM